MKFLNLLNKSKSQNLITKTINYSKNNLKELASSNNTLFVFSLNSIKNYCQAF